MTATANFAQDATNKDDATKPFQVCSTWKAKDAGKGACRTAFMRAASPLGRKCKSKTIPEAGQGHINVYMAACHCEKECK